MIREIGQFSATRTTRRRAAAWLALLLNFALVPCAMALEPADPGHDCCPPSIELQADECCVVDDVCVDSRTSDDLPTDVVYAYIEPLAAELISRGIPIDASPPPRPDASPPPIHLVNCVFLK